MKAFYSATELANMKLSSCAKSIKGVMKKAKKENWQHQKRSGRGGGVEYSFDSLPVDVQKEIKAKHYKSMMKAKASHSVAKVDNSLVSLDSLSDWQRKVAYSRIMLLNLLDDYVDELGKKELAYQQLSELSKVGELPVIGDVDYNAVADDCVVKTAKGNVGLGVTIVKRWYITRNKCKSRDEIVARLAPKKQGRAMVEPECCEWLADFLMFYCSPQGYCVAEAYRKFVDERLYKNPSAEIPSLPAVRRVHERLPKWVRVKNRVSGSARRALFGYVRRDWNADFMRVNDIWVGDGHSLKVRVKHPQHGQPFNPELTLIMDAVSRFIVGWSLSFSESGNAVGEALCYGFVHYGFCAIYYSDNGSGQKNKMLDAEVHGFFARLGIEHTTGIPSNPQGRGIIERQMKEVPKRVAMSFDTYHGNNADPNYVRKMLIATDSYKKAVVKGVADDGLTDNQRWASKILPTWDELVAEVKKQIYDYNHNRVHSAIKKTPAEKRAELLEKYADDTEIVMPSPNELKDMFRPHFERVVRRGQVRFDDKFYYDEVLENYDGKKVAIFVDIHDASSIIVKDDKGVYLCEARLNSTPAFSRAFVESARAKSNKARVKRKQDSIDAIMAEDRNTLEHNNNTTLADLIDVDLDVLTVKPNKPKLELDLYGSPDDDFFNRKVG